MYIYIYICWSRLRTLATHMVVCMYIWYDMWCDVMWCDVMWWMYGCMDGWMHGRMDVRIIYIYIYIYICAEGRSICIERNLYVYMYMCIYIYIYRERERDVYIYTRPSPVANAYRRPSLSATANTVWYHMKMMLPWISWSRQRVGWAGRSRTCAWLFGRDLALQEGNSLQPTDFFDSQQRAWKMAQRSSPSGCSPERGGPCASPSLTETREVLQFDRFDPAEYGQFLYQEFPY